MMDGYSVQDAASVLGVPEGRVWELLARGVLAGTPEGDSMRVFLKVEAARPAPREALPRSNGNGESHGAEASAFRELLTEFRNLTERYGQALLALGEARGEVAGLRSRVELLEARIDLRLPARMEAEPIAWETPAPRPPAPEAPAPEAPAPEPPAPAEVEAVLPAPAPVERPPRQRKSRSTRAAVAGFAEALARAQDPNIAPVGEVTASTEVAVEMTPEPGVLAEAEAEPGELAVAEQPAAPEQPAEATYRAAEVEPDWFADGDFSWLDAAEVEARSQQQTVAVEAPTAPAAEPTPEEPILEVEAEAAPEPGPEPVPIVESDVQGQPEAVAEPEPEPEPEAEPEAPAIGQMEPVDMSDAGEEPVMWLGGARDAEEMETATARSYPGPSLSPRIRDALEPAAWPATDRGASTAQAVAPPLAMTEEELAQLARDEGWDDAEVAAIRAMISRPSSATVELPGSAELDEAMSALQAVPIAPRRDAAPGSQWAKPVATGEDEGPRLLARLHQASFDEERIQSLPLHLSRLVIQVAMSSRRESPRPAASSACFARA